MEKEGDIVVQYVRNDNGDPLHGEKRVCGLEIRPTPYGKVVVIW